jgi:hypothetical protein
MVCRRLFITVGLITAMAAGANAEDGRPLGSRINDGFKRVVHNWYTDFRRNNCWPEPFVYTDRQLQRAPLDIHIAKGWQAQNTLGFWHFKEDSSQLTEAGRLKVESIMTQAPPRYRAIFVPRDVDPTVTSSRIELVQEYASLVSENGEMPHVAATGQGPHTSAAEYVDSIQRKFNASTPEPRLKSASSEGSDSGGN